MSLIKFPSNVKPSRVTVNLERRDEMFVSPATGIQQVASRGNAFWRWTYEFKDISLSERETVQAFLAKCRGALNSFKVHDPAGYQVGGTISDWIDVYEERGTEWTGAGSGTNKVNSYFTHNVILPSHITDEDVVRFNWGTYLSAPNMQWQNTNLVQSLEAGKAYVQRIKFFQHPERKATRASFAISSGGGGGSYLMQASPRVTTDSVITAPFYTGNNTSVVSYFIRTVDWTNLGVGQQGDYYQYADYRLSRCALMSNSENLLTYSHEFDHADWTTSNATVSSGWGEMGPTGVNSYAWKLAETTDVNTLHILMNTYTKINTEDIYAFAVEAHKDEQNGIRLMIHDDDHDPVPTNYVQAYFDLTNGVTFSNSGVNGFIRPNAKIFDIGSDWYRCVISGMCNSNNIIRASIFVVSGTSAKYSGVAGEGVLIRHAQLRKHPFAGHYVPTTGTIVVGTGWQTGSKLYVEGLDPEAKLKAGTRLEIVNRFAATLTPERSEYKKLTEEVVAHKEGWAILPIDPPIRNAPETLRMTGEQQNLGETMHNPVIFDRPEMTARLLGGTVQYIEKPLQLTDVVFEVIEDLSE
jgi:hypothetical protein